MYNGRLSLCAALVCAIFFAAPCLSHAAITHDPSPVKKPVHKTDPLPDTTTTTKTTVIKKKPVKKSTITTKNRNAPAKPPARPRITDFRLASSSPYAVLTHSDGRTSSIPLVKDGHAFSADTIMGAIPAGTRINVPEGYKVYCADGHTMLISGKNFRTNFNGRTMVQYDSGSEIEYISNSGVVIIPSEFADDPFQTKPLPVITNDTDISGLRIAKNEPVYENRSDIPEDVIETYEISRERKDHLIRMHHEASRMLSKEGRSERYEEIFRDYENDYLAAYGVALAEFDMYNGERCIEWCDIALSINRRYLPAKLLRKRAEGII